MLFVSTYIGHEMVVCEEHKTELVDFNAAGAPKGIATTPRRISGAA